MFIIHSVCYVRSDEIVDPSPNLPITSFEKHIVVKKGDNFTRILSRLGINLQTIPKIVHSIESYYPVHKLAVNQKINFFIKCEQNQHFNSCVPYYINISFGHDAFQGRYNASDDRYIFYYDIKNTEHDKVILIQGFSGINIYDSILKAGAPEHIANEYMQILRDVINFKQDLEYHSKFRILFSCLININGHMIDKGRILFVSLNAKNKVCNIFKFNEGKKSNYFLENGSLLQQDFFIKPVKEIRVTSKFGCRIHPISGSIKMHTGIDLAARIGTPIQASAGGIIIIAKANKGYGKYIVIKHNQSYSTLYAHMKSFHDTVQVGKYVSQGDTIGYVGNSGTSTAPHLHYEIRRNGKPVNPQNLNMKIKEHLTGQKLLTFIYQKTRIQKLLDTHRTPVK